MQPIRCGSEFVQVRSLIQRHFKNQREPAINGQGQRRDMMAASDNDFIRTESPTQGVTLVTPTEDIDMSRSPALRSVIKSELKPGCERLIIDLSGVQYMDSSGLATLVEAMRIAKTQSVTLHLASMTAKVRAIFEIARLDAFFSIKDTLQEALDS